MAIRDTDRQAQILEGRLAGLTYAQIARRLNVSRQRVHQLIAPPKEVRDAIIKKYNGRCFSCGYVVNGSGHIHHTSCNGEDYNDTANLQLLCISCHHTAHKQAPTSFCPVCGKIKSKRNQHCSRECSSRSHQVQLTCASCGKIFYRTKTATLQRYKYRTFYKENGYNRTHNYFCSRECYGKWLGQHYGRGRHTTVMNIVRGNNGKEREDASDNV